MTFTEGEYRYFEPDGGFMLGISSPDETFTEVMAAAAKTANERGESNWVVERLDAGTWITVGFPAVEDPDPAGGV